MEEDGRTSNDFAYTKATMLGTERSRVSNYRLKMKYPLKAQNPGKGLHLGFTEMQRYQYVKVFSDYMNDSIPTKDYNGLKIWFHDAFEVLSDDSVNIQLRDESYSRVLIIPRILKVDDSMMDFELEELVWFLFFSLSMVLAFLMVQQVYEKLQKSEIYMSLDGKATNVEDIPFPALTIVPDINDHYGFQYIPMIEETEKHDARWKRDVDDDDDYYSYLVKYQVYAVICRTLNNVDRARKPFNFSSTSDPVDMLRMLTEEETPWFIYRKATWNSFVDPPFAEILTHIGISPDFLYTYDGYNDTNFPWKARAGYNFGLDVTFRMNKLWQGCVNYDSFIIHPSNELPINAQIVRHEDLATSDVFITPEIVKTDDDLKHVDISLRKCYFDDERKLNYFKIYTRRNCEQECLTEIIYLNCGCVPFYYVRNESVTVCEYRRFHDCALKFESFSNFSEYDHLYPEQGKCNCLPLCNYVSYTYEVVTKVYQKVQNTTISLMWKDAEYYAQIRYQQFKLVDFLSYVGGILGLFAGISVLSIVEFFYYFTLRLFSNLLRFLVN
ncbi:pickpocket protein 28-like [Chironomus tepperi]|uniref:pickpocket protein 28-like n=1 Tax=Chironomus tepperi TaxID=113505 RepID=UPI00391FB29B